MMLVHWACSCEAITPAYEHLTRPWTLGSVWFIYLRDVHAAHHGTHHLTRTEYLWFQMFFGVMIPQPSALRATIWEPYIEPIPGFIRTTADCWF